MLQRKQIIPIYMQFLHKWKIIGDALKLDRIVWCWIKILKEFFHQDHRTVFNFVGCKLNWSSIKAFLTRPPPTTKWEKEKVWMIYELNLYELYRWVCSVGVSGGIVWMSLIDLPVVQFLVLGLQQYITMG